MLSQAVLGRFLPIESSTQCDLGPPAHAMKPNYGEIDYWNTRYVGDTVYEWYRDFKGLRKILLEYLSKEAPILQVCFVCLLR